MLDSQVCTAVGRALKDILERVTNRLKQGGRVRPLCYERSGFTIHIFLGPSGGSASHTLALFRPTLSLAQIVGRPQRGYSSREYICSGGVGAPQGGRATRGYPGEQNKWCFRGVYGLEGHAAR